MSRIALVVEFKVKPGKREDFLKVIRGHAAGTKQDEPGCLQFDVLIPDEGENTVMLFEMYKDDAAFGVHVNSPRLKATRSAYEGLYESRTITKTRVDG